MSGKILPVYIYILIGSILSLLAVHPVLFLVYLSALYSFPFNRLYCGLISAVGRAENSPVSSVLPNGLLRL